MCRLRDLDIGDSARVVGFAPTHRLYRAKLLSMGLIRGARITVRNVAPLGDPVHITVHDFDLSLRKDEADALILAREEGSTTGHHHRSGRHAGSGVDHRPGSGHGRRHGNGHGWRVWLRKMAGRVDREE